MNEGGAPRLGRARLGLRSELILVALPTITVLVVFAFVESLTKQRLLFASLASSAFLIYLDPEHPTNQVKTLFVAQLSAAILGYGALSALGAGYGAAAASMVATTALLVTLDLVHPPAISTALAFAFRDVDSSVLVLFALAVVMIGLLIGLEHGSLWLLRRSRGLGAK